MSKPDTNLSPDKKGESKKKKLSETDDIGLIEFNMKIPTVYYDFFSAVINLLEWKYDHVIEYFEKQLVDALAADLRSNASLSLPETLIRKFEETKDLFCSQRQLGDEK